MKGVAAIAAVLLGFGALLVMFMTSDAGPQVRIETPPADSTVSGTVAITGSASDPGQVAGVKVRIDAGDWLIASDTSSDTAWSAWSVIWDTLNTSDGPHQIVANAWDSSGREVEATLGVRVANPPWVTILAPANGTTAGGTLTIAGESGDPAAGDAVELVQVAIDPTTEGAVWSDATTTTGWAEWSFEWNTSAVGAGWHTVAARAFDGDLYSEPWASTYFIDNRPYVQFVHPRLDTMPPESVGGIVLVHGTAGDLDVRDHVKLVQIRIDGGAWNDAMDTSPDGTWSVWAYQWNSTGAGDGEHELCARAWDGKLYSDAVCGHVFVSNECNPPTISIVEPAEGEIVRGLVLIHGVAADDRGVWLVQLQFDNDPWVNATDTSPGGSWTTWGFGWDTTNLDDGCRHVYARAWDGNQFSEVDVVTVCVDNRDEQPSVAIENPTSGETVRGVRLVNGYAGGTRGIRLVQVQIDDGGWSNATDTGREGAWSTWAFEWNTSSVTNGAHQVCARAVDGTVYSLPACVTVTVQNDPGPSTPMNVSETLQAMGLPPWLQSGGYLIVLLFPSAGGVVVWLRYMGYVGK